MGEEEENNNTTSVLSRTQSSLELLCNTAAWKNAVEKTWNKSPTSTTAGKQQHPTEVLIMPQQKHAVGSLPAANNFARSTSPLSLAGHGGGLGGDASSVNHVTTASSVSSFDDSSSPYYSTSPLSTSSVVHQLANTSDAGSAAAAAYRTAAMMGLPLRLLGMPNMMNPGNVAAAAASTSSSPHLRPMMSADASGAAPFSSTTSTSDDPPQGRAAMPLSLPTLSGNKKGATAAGPSLFHLEKTPPQGSSTGSNAAATATLLSEANLILSANNGGRSPSPPQVMMTTMTGASSYPQPMMTEEQPPPLEQVVAVPVPVVAVGPKNKKKLVAIMAQENKALKEKVTLKDKEIMKLRKEMAELKNQIQELRQLPTGKISQIPVEDMIEMMQLYGSEVSDSVMPIRKNQNIQKASIVRQFRRWNPNFLEHFHHVHGKWVPKLGRDGELKRRQDARLERRKSSSSSGASVSSAGAASSSTTASSLKTTTTTKNNKFNINTIGLTTTTKVSRKKMKKSSP